MSSLLSRWWFSIIFYVHPEPWGNDPNLTCAYFWKMGWRVGEKPPTIVVTMPETSRFLFEHSPPPGSHDVHPRHEEALQAASNAVGEARGEGSCLTRALTQLNLNCGREHGPLLVVKGLFTAGDVNMIYWSCYHTYIDMSKMHFPRESQINSVGFGLPILMTAPKRMSDWQ